MCKHEHAAATDGAAEFQPEAVPAHAHEDEHERQCRRELDEAEDPRQQEGGGDGGKARGHEDDGGVVVECLRIRISKPV